MNRKITAYDPAKHLQRLYGWAVLAMTLFAGALVINYYRKPLLGYEPKWVGIRIL